MASADMADFLREVPGCFFFIGGARPAEDRPHHSPRFDFDEAVLPLGVAVLCETVASYLEERQAAGAGIAGRIITGLASCRSARRNTSGLPVSR
jgi:hypothetical protein